MLSAVLTGTLMLVPGTKDPLAGRTIVIDPGHGGRDSGAIGNGLEEAPVVLSLSRTIARVLRSEGAKVVLTRSTDRHVLADRYGGDLGHRNLAARVELANRVHADLFLSIHANKYPTDSSIHGTQVFIGGSPDTNRMVLATCLQQRLNRVTMTHWPVNEAQPLYLMEHLRIPAALVEVGYLSNAHEARLLVDPAHQERLAAAIAQGLRCYYARSSSPLPMTRQLTNASESRHSSARLSTTTEAEMSPITHSVAVREKLIALTFDDGPNTRYTPQILKILRRSGAKATFFVVGGEVIRSPSVLRMLRDAGMEIGNHGMRHMVLRGKTAIVIEREARAGAAAIMRAGGPPPVLYRLPTGVCDATARRVLGRLGYRIVGWTVDTRDYVRGIRPERIERTVLSEAAPGRIVLMHDGPAAHREATVVALARILPVLQREGYRFVTVGELLRSALPASDTTPHRLTSYKGTHMRNGALLIERSAC